MNPIAEKQVSITKVSWAIRTVPRAWRCWDSSRSTSCWWFPLGFLPLGVVSHVRSEGEPQLRTSGPFTTGESLGDDKAACFQHFLSVGRDILVLTTTWRNKLTRKIYGPKINRSRKAVVRLARRTKPRLWFMTLVFL